MKSAKNKELLYVSISLGTFIAGGIFSSWCEGVDNDSRRKKELAEVLGIERSKVERIAEQRDYDGDSNRDYIVLFKDGRESLYLSKGYEESDISGKVEWKDNSWFSHEAFLKAGVQLDQKNKFQGKFLFLQ